MRSYALQSSRQKAWASKKASAPAFSEDDSKVGKKYDLPFVRFVDGKGELPDKDKVLKKTWQSHIKVITASTRLTYTKRAKRADARGVLPSAKSNAARRRITPSALFLFVLIG